jgi:hypothetical protein
LPNFISQLVNVRDLKGKKQKQKQKNRNLGTSLGSRVDSAKPSARGASDIHRPSKANES